MNGLDPIRHSRTDGEPGHWHGVGPPAPGREPRIARPSGWLSFDQGNLSQEQVLKNLEQVVSMLQTASVGLDQIDDLLTDSIAVLSAHWSAREGQAAPPEELRDYTAQRLAAMEEIARGCRFHGRGLLDGQCGVAGAGRGVVFIRGGPNTATSPPEGYAVRITDFPSRAAITGGVPVNEDWIWAEQEVFLAEGDRFVRFRAARGNSVTDFLRDLQEAVRASGLDLDIALTQQRRLVVRHTQYGSQFKFKGSSLNTPLLSKRPGKLEWSRKGTDIQGSLGGEPAFGIGRMLVGFLDNEHTSELAIAWKGEAPKEGQGFACQLVQNGIAFQDSETPEAARLRISLPSLLPKQLGRWVDTRSGVPSLAALNTDSWQEVLDGLYVLLAVSGEVVEWKDRVRAWIERYQNRALISLRQGFEAAPEPPTEPACAGRAESMATLLRDRIQGGPGTAE